MSRGARMRPRVPPLVPFNPDACQRRQIKTLKSFIDWLKLVNVQAGGSRSPARGYIGETSIPGRLSGAVIPPRDAYRWTPLLEQMFDMCRRSNLWLTYWLSSEQYVDTEETIFRGTNAATEHLHASATVKRYLTADAVPGRFACGVAQDDMSTAAATRNAATRDGYDNFDWRDTSTGYLDGLAKKGVKLLRVSFQWHRIQRDLGAAFATSAPDLQSILTTFLTNANARGFKVILDQHSHLHYTYWDGVAYQSHMVGDATATITYFGDFWQRMSTLIKGNATYDATVVAYGLSNEPADTPAVRPSDGCRRTSTLNDWEDGTTQGWTGEEAVTNRANDNTLSRSGTRSIKFTRAFGASGYGQVRMRRNSAPAVDAANTAFGYWVFLPSGGTGTDWNARVFAYSSGFTNYPGTSIRLYKGHWNYVAGAPRNTVTGLDVLGDATGGIGDIGVEISCNDGGGTTQINIDDGYRGVASAAATVQWAMQHALTAIRSTGDTKAVIVAGNQYGNVGAYATQHPAGPWIYDPSDNMMYEGHQYHNYDGSGDYSTENYEAAISTARAQGY